MNIQPDFEELLKLLEEHNITYMLVGGYAVALHGYPRFTKDIDIFFDPDVANAEKLKLALIKFGFSKDVLPLEVFTTPGNILAFGVEPVRIDLMNQIDGVLFSEAIKHVVRAKYGNITVSVIGINQLIQNKQSTQRLKDKADAEELKKLL